MATIEISAGRIDYLDTGGEGPVLVLTHGFPMTGSQWRKVVPLLTREGYRCVLPTLPMGAHRHPMAPGADLSQRGQALLLAEFIERLGSHEVTLIMNDWGGAQFVISEGRDERIARLIMVACEAFDNFPPKPARPLLNLLRLPGGTWMVSRLLRTRFVRHNRRALGGMCNASIPDEVMDEWFAPALDDPAIRRDMAAFGAGTPSRATLLAWSERLRRFERPALIVWAGQDTMMPPEHGPRLADLLPNSELVVIEESGTLIPEDRPTELAHTLLAFLRRTDKSR